MRLLFVPAVVPVMPIPDRSTASCEAPLTDVPRRAVALECRLLLCRMDAGFPSPAADDLEEPIDLGRWLVERPAARYVMRVVGSSMAAANIADGDHVVVDRSVAPSSGHIVVALVHGDRTLKRLRRRGGGLWLVPRALADHPLMRRY